MITVALCEEHRIDIHRIAERVMETRRLGSPDSEVISNLIIAHRHLEDAAMRMDLAIQALDVLGVYEPGSMRND